MARSIWKGSISFGLVNIPVSLTAAEAKPDIQLHMVDSKNHARIRYERVNADTGAEVPWDRLVKGYEHEDGQFILLSEDDMEAVRLAVHVEDHPLDYGSFEGTIPKGNYGAGSVAIWDRGIWEPLERNWRRGFDKGKLTFLLHGDRLRGAYLLARMKEEPNWLLRKLDDAIPPDHAPSPPREKAAFVAPQLARVASSVPTGKQWWHELKFDGYRLIAVKSGGRVTLYTRSKHDWTDRFGDLADHLAALTEHDFVLDGEAVVFDEKGRSRFGDLQAALKSGHQERIAFVAFDLLHLDGWNLRALPLSQRFDELAKLVGEESARLRLSKVWPASEGADLFRQACVNGLEGIISKRSVGRYLEGTRRDWLKSKCRARQEFVICGYTAPKGSLRGFGALLLASFENGKLIPRGKVGTGFSDRDRLRLVERFKPMVAKKPPLPAAESGVTWLRPELVAEVEFAEITRDGAIRQGSFVALREDLSAAGVHLDAIATTGTRGKPLKIAGITITHPDRVVYPADGITKMEVARYYERVADSMPVNWSDLATTTADGFTLHEPLRPPDEWIEPEPQLIPKALLRLARR